VSVRCCRRARWQCAAAVVQGSGQRRADMLTSAMMSFYTIRATVK